jgi:hypothetical protein
MTRICDRLIGQTKGVWGIAAVWRKGRGEMGGCSEYVIGID